jgi:hypothetical protein
MGVSHSLEGRLVRFVEEILQDFTSAFEEISMHSESLLADGSRYLEKDFVALDLASVRAPHSESSAINSLAEIIPKAVSYLQEKRHQLQEWKQKRSLRLIPNPSTPNTTPESVPHTPEVLDAWEKMKTVLQDEVISPSKFRKPLAVRLDPEYLQNVINSLEGQIDGLLSDLRSANDALKVKDQLFADLENLVSHHESERDLLESKIESMAASVTDTEERFKKEVTLKEAAEKTLASLQQRVGEDQPVVAGTEAKRAAVRLIGKVLERRSDVTKAVAFRQWACQTSAIRAVSQQGDAAAALAQQLQTTREKLLILKRHLKTTRRGREPSLDRIMEGYETS